MNPRFSFNLAALLCAAMGACAPVDAQAVAGTGGERMIERLREADANGDGAVTHAEFTFFRSSQFSRLDRNKDGSFTASDIPARLANRIPADLDPAAMIAQSDVNKDGKVSEKEFVNGPAPIFERADVNKDNVVTDAEIDAALSTLRAAR